ncbi:MAG: phosphoenolpyruvate carboxylase, partial [Pseudomonadota bacterium]
MSQSNVERVAETQPHPQDRDTLDPAEASARMDADFARRSHEVIDLLRGLFLQVVESRHPDLLSSVSGHEDFFSLKGARLQKYLQLNGIWLQLLAIAEENAAAHTRRQTETREGREILAGSFAALFARAAAQGIPAATIRSLVSCAKIQPVLTAHPTEAKRVTVLEIHRRIYRHLVELETDRWTPRERVHKLQSLQNEIDLLLLTGEIRLTKPTVGDEVAWGLHFFREIFFEQTPEVLNQLEEDLEKNYPNEAWQVPALLQFGSWIGGDRDGNPFVTNEITEKALFSYRDACLTRYRDQLRLITKKMSIGSHSIDLPSAFLAGLSRCLALSGLEEEIKARNPGEVFRQFAAAMEQRIGACMVASAASQAYREADEFLTDLTLVETALKASGYKALAAEMIKPLRREVEIFAFRTASLDLRENSDTVRHCLEEIWSERTGNAKDACPDASSKAWQDWILSELSHPQAEQRHFNNLSDSSQKTYGLFQSLRRLADKLDRRAGGAIILSMTRSVADILSVYLLCKYAGLFVDQNAQEICR